MAMKYKTFRNIVVMVGGAVILLAGYGVTLYLRERARAERAEALLRYQEQEQSRLASLAEAQARARAAGASDPAAAPDAAPEGALSPLHQATLARALAGISGDKLKDGVPGHGGAKVNLYADGAVAGQVTRLKIDLNGNGKWEEKWTFATPGQEEGVKRQVATNDDEQYDREYLLVQGAWKAQGASEVPQATAAPPPSDAGEGDEGLRPMDRQILEKVRAGISGDKQKDAWPQGWKVNLYADAKDGVVNRLKVDLDRDEKFDEKWTVEREGGELKVKRQVSSGDDDTLYDKEFRLDGERWRLKR